jgi:hypothetical protein
MIPHMSNLPNAITLASTKTHAGTDRPCGTYRFLRGATTRIATRVSLEVLTQTTLWARFLPATTGRAQTPSTLPLPTPRRCTTSLSAARLGAAGSTLLHALDLWAHRTFKDGIVGPWGLKLDLSAEEAVV